MLLQDRPATEAGNDGDLGTGLRSIWQWVRAGMPPTACARFGTIDYDMRKCGTDQNRPFHGLTLPTPATPPPISFFSTPEFPAAGFPRL